MADIENILTRIVNRKKPALAEEMRRIPVEQLIEQSANMPDSNRSFAQALQNPNRIAVIAELKKASPSKGVIRLDLDASKLANELSLAGADALSVLTETDFFLGNRENLLAARAAAPNTPIIRKDFIFDEYQIYQAKIWGADAVLLIAAMLPTERMLQLSQLATSLKLDVLFEAHNEDEIKAILPCNPKIVGINARNLKTFKTDLQLATNLMQSLPSDVVKVSESAITSSADLQLAYNAGANAALVGETLMRAESPADRLRELYED